MLQRIEALDVVRATRQSESVLVGAGPRATQSLMLASRAHAALQGRDFVTPDDIRSLDDRSGEFVPLGSYDLNDKLQLWANFSLRHGGQNSEYSQLVKRSAMLGLTWFAW